ncbi:hypothetical protein AVEN_113050-1 [Araneus ventricosus]|uniref:Uncharacterized protein n=1 Tax=Araneus ventricosus TaxID=182803 RepID=A0A4Y2TH91_ARAVE|nr:hypothetical protein AVEN_113050-1 [Araneus ventricosus]
MIQSRHPRPSVWQVDDPNSFSSEALFGFPETDGRNKIDNLLALSQNSRLKTCKCKRKKMKHRTDSIESCKNYFCPYLIQNITSTSAHLLTIGERQLIYNHKHLDWGGYLSQTREFATFANLSGAPKEIRSLFYAPSIGK